MKKQVAVASVVLVFSASFVSCAIARNTGKLPDDAVPLSAEATKAIFSGKTINWEPAQTYWSTDGKAIGFYPVKGKEGFGEGRWTVNGNEMCYHLEWRGASKAEKPFISDSCAKYFKSGKKIWIENIKDEKKYQGDIWTGIENKLVTGDKASALAAAYKIKFGY